MSICLLAPWKIICLVSYIVLNKLFTFQLISLSTSFEHTKFSQCYVCHRFLSFLTMCLLIAHAEIPPDQEPLSWYTRMKIAFGAAKGLEYLHEKANPPVIYRDLKSSNILLGKDYNAKLSDFGLAKLGPLGDNLHVSSRVMGTFGYCAPEYVRTGQLTLKSDVYSFGVVFLELITGRRVIDTTKPTDEQNLVTWV